MELRCRKEALLTIIRWMATHGHTLRAGRDGGGAAVISPLRYVPYARTRKSWPLIAFKLVDYFDITVIYTR